MPGSSLALLLAIAAFLVALVWQVRPAFLWREGADGRRGGGRLAVHLRAVREDPASVQTLQRAIEALARRPRSLEVLLWRHLAAAPWEGRRDAVVASLDALRSLYEGRLRSPVRARAIAHAKQNVVGKGPRDED